MWQRIFEKAIQLAKGAPIVAGARTLRTPKGVLQRRRTLKQNTTIIKDDHNAVVFTGNQPRIHGQMTPTRATQILESMHE